jgi:hypothetical protein
MIVKDKIGELMLSAYNSMDMDLLFAKLCSEENQVTHNLY